MLTFFFAFPSPGDAAAEDDSPGGSTTERARVVSPRRHRVGAGARARVAGVARASRVVVARASGARAGVDVGMFPSGGRRMTSAEVPFLVKLGLRSTPLWFVSEYVSMRILIS